MQYTQRENELIELALKFYYDIRKGTASAAGVKGLLTELQSENTNGH